MPRAEPSREGSGAPERPAGASRRSLAFATSWPGAAPPARRAAATPRRANPFASADADTVEELAPTRAALQQLIELNPLGVVVVSSSGQVLLHNRAAPAMLAMHPDDFTRRPFNLHRTGPRHDIEVRDTNGQRRSVQVRSVPTDWFGRSVHLVSLREGRPTTSEATEARAFHDPITGLPSRELFLNRVNDRMNTGGRPTDDPMAVARIDLDRFRRVNDFYGAHVGDRVLQIVANRLTSSVRPGDYVARFGDDDFAIYFPPGRLDDQRQVADRVLDALQQPYDVDGLVILCNPTIGLATHEPGQDEETLVTAAEVALVTDRLSGSGSGAVSMARPSEEGDHHRATVSRALARELAGHQLVVSYEPQFDVHDQTLVGLEAIVQWEHPDDGLIGLGDNAQVIDEDGRKLNLSEWTVREVVDQIVDWQERRPDAGIPPVTVPVATRQLLDADFRRIALFTLAQHEIPPSALRLAVSESALSDRSPRIDQALTELAEDGFAIDLEHFGTGTASMSTLQELPLSGIKLDRLLVEHMVDHPDARRFVEATIMVAHTFELAVAAVGVDSSDQRTLLYRSACDRAQGQHLGRPLSAIEVARFLAPATAKAPARNQGLLRRGAALGPATDDTTSPDGEAAIPRGEATDR